MSALLTGAIVLNQAIAMTAAMCSVLAPKKGNLFTSP
jgi:hypothetical protein